MIRAELKKAAKEQIKGNIGNYFLCGLITTLITIALVFIPLGSIISIFVTAPIMYGFKKLELGMTRNEKVSVSGLFKGFDKFGTSILLKFLMGLFTMLWSLLLIVPGIIKSLSYSMAYYVLADNEDMTALEAINESKRIMKGHKWELFVLGLSFIPWILLATITLGLGYIYVAPYMAVTTANFYNNIKAENDNLIEEF